MNILREDWKPVLSLQAVLVGLQYLFLEPNADDPLNKGIHILLMLFILAYSLILVAAEVLKTNRKSFENNVKKAMMGGSFDGVQYDYVLQ